MELDLWYEDDGAALKEDVVLLWMVYIQSKASWYGDYCAENSEKWLKALLNLFCALGQASISESHLHVADSFLRCVSLYFWRKMF